jgi:hypothetical protein
VYVNAEHGNTLWADADTSGPATVFTLEQFKEESEPR